MLVLVHLFVFEGVVAPELGVASSHRIGGFQQVIAEETVTGFDELPILGFKFPGLMLGPDKAGELGHGCLGLKAVYVANLGDDTSGINFADSYRPFPPMPQ